MTKEDIIRKLTSRKFWLAISAFVSGLLLAFKVNAQTAETVSGVIMSGAAVVAYIVGEGMADAASGGADTNIIVQNPTEDKTE